MTKINFEYREYELAREMINDPGHVEFLAHLS